jgi:hypothetical protein
MVRLPSGGAVALPEWLGPKSQNPRQLLLTRVKGLGCFIGRGRRFIGDDLCHSPMISEGPAFPDRNISGGDCFGLTLGRSVRGETNDGPVAAVSACSARRAGRVRVRRRAYRDPSTLRSEARKSGYAITVFADRLSPFLLAAPERSVSASVGSGKDGYDGRQLKLGELVRMRPGCCPTD